MAVVKWKPIEDLPGNWPELVSSELGSLAEVWKTQATRLHESQAVKQFNERLAREWAIETGIIENLYSIDRGTTQLLIEKGIVASLIAYGTTDQPAEKIVPILQAQQAALEGLFAFVKQERPLSTSYVKELHQAITRHQETVAAKDEFGNLMEVRLIRGDWKKLPNNPTRPDGAIHQYAPPEQVASEMDTLMAMYGTYSSQNVSPEVEAAWLHHRFAQIHPFQDGNGRVARALATLVFLRAGWFPLVVTRDDRAEYIEALEKADDGDLSPLVQLFAGLQKKALIKALSLSEDVIQKSKSIQEAITSIGERIRKQNEIGRDNIYSEAFALSSYLENIAGDELKTLAKALNKEFASTGGVYVADIYDEKSPTPYRNDLVRENTKILGYHADTTAYHKLVGLKIDIGQKGSSYLWVSFHGVGAEFVGIIAILVLLESARGGYLESINDRANPSEDFFVFSYDEDKSPLVKRFQVWLDKKLLEGLDRWRIQLF